MRSGKKFAIAAAALAIALLVVFVRPHEGALFIATKDGYYDPVGAVHAAIIRSRRDCRTVSSLTPSSSDWRSLQRHLSERVGGTASPLQVLHEGRWYLAESEYDTAEPYITLLEKVQGGYVERGGWGGDPGPFLYEPAMWSHLRSEAPHAPKSLIHCFERK